MVAFLFSCLQGVQTNPEQNPVQDLCISVCSSQEETCLLNQSCTARCTSLVLQLETKNCTKEAEQLWTCQNQGTWTCVEGNASFVGETCRVHEDLYLECIVPEDTGALGG